VLAKNSPKPPGYLRPETRAWFSGVIADYDMQPHHIKLLTLAAEAWDRGQQARELLLAEGVIVTSRQGPKAHPGIAIERDARLAFARIVAQLSLDTEPPIDSDTRSAQRSTRPGGWKGLNHG
jgi:phage terminase small subunit